MKDRKYFAVDKRSPVPITDAAKALEASKDVRAVVVSGVVVGSVDVPANMVNVFDNDLFKKVPVPLIGQASVDAPKR